MLELLKLLVEFTPTEKDDRILEDLESFIVENPEVVGFIFKLLRHKF